VLPRLNTLSLAQSWRIPSWSRENTFRTASCTPSGVSAWYAVEGVVPRGQQPEIAAAALLCVGAEPIRACLRYYGKVDPLGEVKGGALKPVDDRCARWALVLIDSL
jgi:hypothetical protein